MNLKLMPSIKIISQCILLLPLFLEQASGILCYIPPPDTLDRIEGWGGSS